MYIDFKKTIWERVYLPDEMTVNEIKLLMDENSAAVLNNILIDEKGCNFENIYDSEEFIEPEDNDNQPTIEVFCDNGEEFNNMNYKE